LIYFQIFLANHLVEVVNSNNQANTLILPQQNYATQMTHSVAPDINGYTTSENEEHVDTSSLVT
jgi:hypothetical protein